MKRRWIRNGSNPRFFVLQDGKLSWYLNHTAGEAGSPPRGSLIIGMDCTVNFDRAVSKQGLYKFEVHAGSNKVGWERYEVIAVITVLAVVVTVGVDKRDRSWRTPSAYTRWPAGGRGT